MFALLDKTEALLTSVTPRTEVHGDDRVFAISLGLKITGLNTLLDKLTPALRHMIYTAKPDAEPELDGIEASTPLLRCPGVELMNLKVTLEGWTLVIDASFDEDNPITIGGCKVDKFRISPSQGGTVDLMFRVGSNDIDQGEAGWLCSHLAREIWITLTPPEKPAEAIDGTTGHPGASGPTAEDLFAADEDEDDCEPEDDEDAGPELEDRLDNALRAADAESAGQASKDALDASGNNPFGRSDEPAPGPTRPARTDRGYRKTRDAIAQGMAEAKAAGLA